jgi:hypothetical protein
MWCSIPSTLRRFDARPAAHVPEPVAVQLLWAVLVHLPLVRTELGLPNASTWRIGGHGAGDLQGLQEPHGDPLVNLELKSFSAQFSVGVRCRHRCEQERNQLLHMREDGVEIVLLAQPARHPYLRATVTALGLVDEVRFLTYAEVADAVAEALRVQGEPAVDLLASLFDVEYDQAA